MPNYGGRTHEPPEIEQLGVSRAISRFVTPGDSRKCDYCEKLIAAGGRKGRQKKQVVCNVYVDGRWNRVEIFHINCYEEAGSPHGDLRTS